MSMFVCDALELVSCVFWSSGVASVNGGVASGLGGVLELSVIPSVCCKGSLWRSLFSPKIIPLKLKSNN